MKILYLFMIILLVVSLKGYRDYTKNFKFSLNLNGKGKDFDIYVFPSSMFTNKIYSFTSILENKGNIINVEYPSKEFDLDDFASKLCDKIIKRKKKCILVGYSFGSLMSNIVNSKFKDNTILKKILLISNSCDGHVTDEARNIYDKMRTGNEDQNKLIYQLLFTPDYDVPKKIKKEIKNNQLSNDIQQSIGTGIGKWITKYQGKPPQEVCVSDNKVNKFIIHGNKDIVYPIKTGTNVKIVEEVGHGIIFQSNDIINKWVKENI
jgi:hypothetical protein